MNKSLKSLKSLISCILVIMILLLSSSMVFAQYSNPQVINYVALGDSTSYGYSDPGGGYVAMFGKYLGTVPVNLSVPGYTTSDLINVINSNTGKIKNASIITINIGGNNLLGPFMQTIASLYGLKLSDYSQPDGSDFLAALAGAVAKDPNPGATIGQLLDQNNPKTKVLNLSLLLGLTKFNIDWPVIVTKVKFLAPKAKIYVNTIFNPAMKASAVDPMYPFYQSMDKLIQSMNNVIKAYSSIGAYKCIDVYAAFAAYTPPVGSSDNVLSFNILNAIAAAKQGNIPEFIRCCDPHPTTTGHTVIFKTLKAIAK